MKEKNNKNEEKKSEEFEEYEAKQNKLSKRKIILIIIAIIILLFCLLSYRIGKIGNLEVFNPMSSKNMKVIEVTSDDIKIIKNTELEIFKNVKLHNKQMIAPRSKGTYKFCVKNVTNQNIVYNISLTDEKNEPINMKYRLKIDNIYIRGNENTYVGIDQLNINDVTVLKDSSNIFTLEWQWQDDDIRDTYVGSLKTDEYYTLRLNIKAYEKIDN